MKTEPAVLIGSLGALVAAIIGLLVAFGLPVSPEQQDAILAVVAVVGPIAVGIITRNFVSPAKSEDEAQG